MIESTYLVALLAAIAGALAGSVLHSISLRLPGELPALGPPPCHSCNTVSPVFALIPGVLPQCANCGARATWHKPVTEIAAAGLAGLAIFSQGVTLTGIATAVFCLNLLLILRIDWQHHLIFTITIWPGVLIAFALAGLESFSALLSSAIAAAGAGLLFILFFALAVWIYRKHALGFGDILLAILIGAMARIELVGGALLLGMILAALGGLFLIAIGKRTRYDYIPYGTYLCLGTMIVLLLPR